MNQRTGGYCAACLNTTGNCACYTSGYKWQNIAKKINKDKQEDYVRFSIGLKQYRIPRQEYNLMIAKLDRMNQPDLFNS